MYTLHYSDSKKVELPKRTVYSMVGHDGIKSNRMSFGRGELPTGKKMDFHKHTGQEEIIYICQGFGKLHIKGKKSEFIEPGTVIIAPSGIDHSLENKSKEAMVWVWVFNPPVKIGNHTPGNG